MTSRLIVLTMSVLAAAVCLRASASQERVPLRRPLAEIPLALGNWTAASQRDFDPATVKVLRADDYVSRNYVAQSADTADMYVGYYETQRQGDTIHSPMNCLPGAGWQLLSVARATVDAAPGQSIVVNRDTIQKGLDTRLVLYWYQSHGRVVASEYWSKVYLVLDSLRLHRTDGALVRVITPIRDSDPRAERSAVDFIRALFPVLNRHLPG
jgi:EpsI family protein